MTKHTILFLAANPLETDRLALNEEARGIQRALERSRDRDKFVLATRLAAQPLDLLDELRTLKPTVVHFSGHGGRGEPRSDARPHRDIVSGSGTVDGSCQDGLLFQGPDGRPQEVSTAALESTFGAAGASVKLVVLNACYSEVQAEALLAHVDCVMGMRGSIRDDAARNFAVGFYGGIGERESIAIAYRQGRAAISLDGLADSEKPQLKVRDGCDADRIWIAQSWGFTVRGLLFGLGSKATLVSMIFLTLATVIGWCLFFPFPAWAMSTDGVLAVANFIQIGLHVVVMLGFHYKVGSLMPNLSANIRDSADTMFAFKRTSIALVQLFVLLMWAMYLLKVWVTCVPCSTGHLDADLTCPGSGAYRWVRSAVVVPFVGAGFVLLRLHRHWSDYRTETDGKRLARWMFYVCYPLFAVLCRVVAAKLLPDEQLGIIVVTWWRATFGALLLAPADLLVLIGLVHVASHLTPRNRTPVPYSTTLIFIYAALQPISSWALAYPQNAFWIGFLSLALKWILIVAVVDAICNGQITPPQPLNSKRVPGVSKRRGPE